jgi:ribosome-associated protein
MVQRSHSIDDSLIEEQFVRASGPGGQNVNKVSSAVQLRYHLSRATIDPAFRTRLIRLAGHHATLDGDIVIHAARFRSQAHNRTDARARLEALFHKASVRPKKRIATAPSRASRERRLAEKRARGELKRQRRQAD